jgi:hypothetical protein
LSSGVCRSTGLTSPLTTVVSATAVGAGEGVGDSVGDGDCEECPPPQLLNREMNKRPATAWRKG